MHLLKLYLAGLTVASLSGPVVGEALAENAPQALRGKSVVVSWTENRMQRSDGEAEFRPRSVSQVMQVYVSSEGRTFERRTAARSQKSGSALGIGGGAVARSGSTRFQGSSLVMVGAMVQGGRMIRVDFDQGFSGCSAKVTIGREGNAETIRGRSLISKKPIEFKSLGASGESCSVREGNIFAR